MRRIVIGVMGPGPTATSQDKEFAFVLGKLIAQEGWVLLSGAGNLGVMDAVNRGAKSAGGTTIGITFFDHNQETSESVDIAIVTGMGSARNNINVLSSDVVIACGLGTGTASEVCLALKAAKPVVLLSQSQVSKDFFRNLGGNRVSIADTPQQAVEFAKRIVTEEISQNARRSR
jgi:uncharacterized protein (TIGR00725 family)